MIHAVRTFALLLILPAAGCGRKGPPLPPIPRGPLPVEAITVRQIGAGAVVTFTLPPPRGPHPSQQPVAVEILLLSYGPGQTPAADPDAFRRRGETVAELREDPLAAGARRRIEDRGWPTDRAGSTLRYAARVQDRRGRPSALVVARDLSILSDVPAPAGLRAEPTADGVRVGWSAAGGEEGASYNLYRAVPDEGEPDVPLNENPLVATEFLDADVVAGRRYRYTVRRSLATGPPYRESLSSDPVEVVAEDLFAPEPPEALVAVQEGAAVRLFWNPNRERDIAGYRVYRAVDGDVWARIGPDPVEQPLFLDDAATVGQQLAYRVTAVDRADPANESEPSDPTSLELVAEPVTRGDPR